MKLTHAIKGYLLFKSARASATTIDTDGVLLRQFTRWFDVDPDVAEIDAETIRRYLDYQKTERKLADASRRRIHAVLSGLYTWLGRPDIGLVLNNPVKTVPAPTIPQTVITPLSQEQIERLLKAADRARMSRRARALLLFLLD